MNLGVFDVNGKPKGDLGPEIDLPQQKQSDSETASDDESSDESSSSDSEESEIDDSASK